METDSHRLNYQATLVACLSTNYFFKHSAIHLHAFKKIAIATHSIARLKKNERSKRVFICSKIKAFSVRVTCDVSIRNSNEPSVATIGTYMRTWNAFLKIECFSAHLINIKPYHYYFRVDFSIKYFE